MVIDGSITSEQDDAQKYVNILLKAEPLLREMRERENLRPPSFNIFFALGHAYREVSTHSALLAYLLDPAAGHGQGTLFLTAFLQIIKAAAERQKVQFIAPATQDGSRWRCRKEVPLGLVYGQADILLRGPEHVLIVENKIYAGDQSSQLRRYWDYLTESNYKQLEKVIIYLTPDGRRPTAQSLVRNTDTPTDGKAEKSLRLICLSYREDIVSLIDCVVGSIEAVSVKEILLQYSELIKGLS